MHEQCLAHNYEKLEYKNVLKENELLLITKENESVFNNNDQEIGKHIKLEFFSILNPLKPFYKWINLINTDKSKKNFSFFKIDFSENQQNPFYYYNNSFYQVILLKKFKAFLNFVSVRGNEVLIFLFFFIK